MEPSSDAPHQPKRIFDGCTIAFVTSLELLSSAISEISAILEGNGAEICDPANDGSIQLSQVTHIIANSIDFPQYNKAQGAMIPVIKSTWVLNCVRKGKLLPVRTFSPDPRLFFSSIVLTCADLPVTDKEVLSGTVTALGGTESADLTRQTTHVCALSMDHPKCKEASRNPKIKIVLPHWFDDCFKLGKRIREAPYVLPDPEVLRIGNDADVKIPGCSSVNGASSTVPDCPVDETNRLPMTVFSRKKVMLSSDLPMTDRLRGIITQLVENGGGDMVDDDIDECDTFVCQYRDGPDYVEAAQAGKDVGNLAWLYHLMTNNEWTSPMQRLLHYPIPRNGIAGFEGLRITVSNYGGEARTYLENLIKAAGAEFTRTMKSDNTHLITARNSGDKCKAADEWNVMLVNHLWIEDCYAKCEMLSPTKRHLHFPTRTNLGEIAGQTFLDPLKLEEKYYPDANAGAKARKGTRKVTDSAARPAETEATSKKQARGRKARSKAPPETPARPGGGSGKEAQASDGDTTAGRTAKARALTNLHNIAPDIALYEKERKRGKDGTGPWGGKRAADQMDRDIAQSSSPVPGKDHDGRLAKRPRTNPAPKKIRVVVTGFERWSANDSTKMDREKKRLKEMGIQMVEPTSPCDYLVAPHIVRTVKFLVALARGPAVLGCEFLETAIETGTVPTPEDFLLKDAEGEERYELLLETTVARARANKGRLLYDIPIYCTSDIRNGTGSYHSICQAHGAIFKIYQGRTSTIRPTTAGEDGAAKPDPVYLLTSPSKGERALWPAFEEMALRGNMEPRIVAPDWLLDVVLQQQVTFDKKYLADPFYKRKDLMEAQERIAAQ